MKAIDIQHGSLAVLDRLGCDLLMLHLYDERRPLKGIGGLVDWRTNGWLTRLVRSRRLELSTGSKTLVPGRRIACSRMLIVGLGDRGGLDNLETFGGIADISAGAAAGLLAGSLATSLPGARINDDKFYTRLAILLKFLKQHRFDGNLTVLVDPRMDIRDIRTKCGILCETINRDGV